MKNNFLLDSDVVFDSLLPKRYQEISKVHWTPKQIIEVSVVWLKEHESKQILDIGSGVGKFCIIGAQNTKMQFTGVEKRKSLYKQAIKIKKKLELQNVNFINDNILNIEFSNFDAFYYFNPFYEQVSEVGRIDKKTTYLPIKFLVYQEHVYNELEKASKGTKIITYCAPEFKLPSSYIMQNMMFEGLLQLWIKNK